MEPLEIISIDGRDTFYLVAGLSFLLLTILPRFRFGFATAPLLFVAAGAALALSPIALPVLDPMTSKLQLKVIEHASELIVIISLAGAGLAIDRPMSLKGWAPAWRLLAITMPLTVAAIAWGGMAFVGLPLAAALLLGASLAPTDPVLARSVQVEGPMEGGEDDVRLGLTAEAGLNDGLAFPFVYLAIAAAGLMAGQDASFLTLLSSSKFADWVWFDLLYRVGIGIVVGGLSGYALAWIVHELGDASQERSDRGENAGLTVLASTFLAYGIAELLSGYGFLAVFVAARAGRNFTAHDEKLTAYNRHPHLFSVQFESILLALLLLWFGGLCVNGLLADVTMGEIVLALLVIFVVRPAAGVIALIGRETPRLERAALAFFGVRGMGTIFYVAYGHSHAEFDSIDSVWRISAVCILVSIAVHGLASSVVMPRLGTTGDDGAGTVDRNRGERHRESMEGRMEEA